MALLQVVKDVCAVVGVAVPQSVFSNITGNRTMQEMLSLANEMAQRIAYDNCDWMALEAGSIFTGDGVSERFPLPANYKRMRLNTNVWRSSSPGQPMRFIADSEEWMRRTSYDGRGEWLLGGGDMRIRPTLPVGITASFLYLDKNCINLASGGRGDVFMSDTDTFVLDERVLKLGMIWQWKAQKGASYAEDMGTYGDALGYAMGHDRPAPIILGRSPISASATVAYPWPVPT
jgi:hypothetical protein